MKRVLLPGIVLALVVLMFAPGDYGIWKSGKFADIDAVRVFLVVFTAFAVWCGYHVRLFAQAQERQAQAQEMLAQSIAVAANPTEPGSLASDLRNLMNQSEMTPQHARETQRLMRKAHNRLNQALDTLEDSVVLPSGELRVESS